MLTGYTWTWYICNARRNLFSHLTLYIKKKSHTGLVYHVQTMHIMHYDNVMMMWYVLNLITIVITQALHLIFHTQSPFVQPHLRHRLTALRLAPTGEKSVLTVPSVVIRIIGYPDRLWGLVLSQWILRIGAALKLAAQVSFIQITCLIQLSILWQFNLKSSDLS